jgi:hypothetical protein
MMNIRELLASCSKFLLNTAQPTAWSLLEFEEMIAAQINI